MNSLHLIKTSNGNLRKHPSSFHLVKDVVKTELSEATTPRWRYAFYEPGGSSNPSTPLCSKIQGLSDLKSSWASASWQVNAHARVGEYCTSYFYNYSEYGYYGEVWFTQVCARAFSVPAALQGSGISRILMPVSSLRLDYGSGLAVVSVSTASSLSYPSSYYNLDSMPKGYAAQSGTISIDTPGMVAGAYLFLFGFLEDFEGADVDETRRYSSPATPGGDGNLDVSIARFKITGMPQVVFS